MIRTQKLELDYTEVRVIAYSKGEKKEQMGPKELTWDPVLIMPMNR